MQKKILIPVYLLCIVVACISTQDLDQPDNNLQNRLSEIENFSNIDNNIIKGQRKSNIDSNDELYQDNERILSSSTGGHGQVTEAHGAVAVTKKRFSNAQMICVFVFFGLLLGMIVREANKKMNLPVAPIIIIIGKILIFKNNSRYRNWFY